MSAEAEPRGVVLPFPAEAQKSLTIHECVQCETWEMQVTEMAGALTSYEKRERANLSKIRRLEHDIGKLSGDDPKIEEARDLFDWWIKQTGRTSKTVFDVERQQAIFRALKIARKMYGKELAKRAVACAIVGAARMAPPDMTTGGKKRHDGLALIFRDAEHFDTNMSRYFAYCAKINLRPAIQPLEA